MNELSTFVNQYVKYNTSTQIGSAILVFLFFLILRKIFAKYVLKICLKISKKTSTELDDKLFISFEKPLMGMFIVIGSLIAIYLLPLQPQIKANGIVFIRIIIIMLITWGLYNFSDASSQLFIGIQQRMGIDLNRAVVPFISSLLKIILIALSLVLILSELDYDISGFIAGLGLGGLAFALAAQETAANLFGGIVIIFDRPFTIGDWILTPSVEGVVEDINLRSTRIRTFGHAVVVMPNSKLTSEPITNWSRMGKRRITFNIGVTYSTNKEKIQICVNKIQEMLKNHPDIHQETILVNFDKFNDSSLDIFLYCFTRTTAWEEYLKVKEDVNYKIMDIMESESVSFAYPSQSIYIENMPNQRDKRSENRN